MKDNSKELFSDEEHATLELEKCQFINFPMFFYNGSSYGAACPDCHSFKVEKYPSPVKLSNGKTFNFGCNVCKKPIKTLVAKRKR